MNIEKLYEPRPVAPGTALVSDYRAIAQHWSGKRNRSWGPKLFAADSLTRVWWNCPRGKKSHTFRMSIRHRLEFPIKYCPRCELARAGARPSIDVHKQIVAIRHRDALIRELRLLNRIAPCSVAHAERQLELAESKYRHVGTLLSAARELGLDIDVYRVMLVNSNYIDRISRPILRRALDLAKAEGRRRGLFDLSDLLKSERFNDAQLRKIRAVFLDLPYFVPITRRAFGFMYLDPAERVQQAS